MLNQSSIIYLCIIYTECPDGLRCWSINPNHYKKFNHTVLAHSRANSSLSFPSLSVEGSGEKTPTPTLSISEVKGFTSETSQESFSALSNCSASPLCSQTRKSSQITNGLQLLRSPGPEDLKKKKGWSSSTKTSVTSSQESKTQLSSTPLRAESKGKTQYLPKCENSLNTEDSISYSPLSELPAEDEVINNEFRRFLFSKDASVSEPEDSVELLTDQLSSKDKLLAELIDNIESNKVQVQKHAPLKTQLESFTSGPPTNQPIQQAASAFDEHRAGPMVKKEAPDSSSSLSKSSIQSSQSIVLERLRETIQGSVSLKDNFNLEEVHTSTTQVSSSERSRTMPPQKGHAKPGQASYLKQMDIGVFFGLKPLKEIEKKIQNGPNELDGASTSTIGEKSRRQRQPRDNRQRRSKADAPAGTSKGTAESGVVDVQGEAKNYRKRRWNRVNAAGELPRCPFYKKIPGLSVHIYHALFQECDSSLLAKYVHTYKEFTRNYRKVLRAMCRKKNAKSRIVTYVLKMVEYCYIFSICAYVCIHTRLCAVTAVWHHPKPCFLCCACVCSLLVTSVMFFRYKVCHRCFLLWNDRGHHSLFPHTLPL